MKKENEKKKLNKKKDNNNISTVSFNEIRKVDPKISYHDGRVDKFLDLFEDIFKKMIDYCKNERNDNWDYLLDKVFEVFGMKYGPFYDKFKIIINMKREEKKSDSLNQTKTNLNEEEIKDEEIKESEEN